MRPILHGTKDGVEMLEQGVFLVFITDQDLTMMEQFRDMICLALVTSLEMKESSIGITLSEE
jgi:hypothetical protein